MTDIPDWLAEEMNHKFKVLYPEAYIILESSSATMSPFVIDNARTVQKNHNTSFQAAARLLLDDYNKEIQLRAEGWAKLKECKEYKHKRIQELISQRNALESKLATALDANQRLTNKYKESNELKKHYCIERAKYKTALQDIALKKPESLGCECDLVARKALAKIKGGGAHC